MTRPLLSTAGACLIALATAGQAAAHAKLMQSDPAAETTGAAPAKLVLTFNEKLEAKFSAVELFAAGVKTPLKSSLGPDRKTLIGVPGKPLGAGDYKVMWRAVSADGHRMQGSYNFHVR